MTAGPVVPDGSLPVYSVDTEAEARKLIVLTCSRDDRGNYYSRELAIARASSPRNLADIRAQLDTLDAFSDKIDRAHTVLVKSGHCTCAPLERRRQRRKI